MRTFLQKAVEHISQQHGSFENVTIVLPSRRSILFIKEAFLQLKLRKGWIPNFYSLEDFILELGDFQFIDQLDLILELYEVHREIELDKADSFENFISWGSILLHDINEIDLNLADGEELFQYLTEAKAIENWDPQNKSLSTFQDKYLRFYRKLAEYYRQFKERLIEKHILYKGLGFRLIAEKLNNNELELGELGQIYFVGFNALTKSESAILNFFKTEMNAISLWDADEYYVDDKSNEAGFFLRQQLASSNSFNWLFNDLGNTEKQIDIYGVSGDLGQSKLIGSKLNLQTPEAFTNTALILADESILIPVLESLPKKVSKVNVTMGHPLQSSSYYFWFEQYLLFFRSSESKDTELSYQLSKLVYFLSHPHFSCFSKNLQEALSQTLTDIKSTRRSMVRSKNLLKLDQYFDTKLFPSKAKRSGEIIDTVLEIIRKLLETDCSELNDLNKAFLFEFQKLFNRLDDLLKEKELVLQPEGLIQLYRQLVSRENVDFIGEPLGGLQIMGMLESRVLDFDQVIISSVNEGLLPIGKRTNSLIPLDIKKKFNLPAHQEKDAIFAYHFYRILQRASKICLVYNTKTDSLHGGEKSRFIEQLLNEMSEKNPKITINHQVVSSSIPNYKCQTEIIQKKDFEKEIIKSHLLKGLSPSSINTFISCPLDYYYKYILKLNESEEQDITIKDNILGNIIHHSLEELYHPFKGQILQKALLEGIHKRSEETLMQKFMEEFGSSPKYGNSLIVYDVACKMTRQMIEHDLKMVQAGNEIRLVSLESEFEADLPNDIAKKNGIALKLKGKIDRIDFFNETLRIIDYKTGAVSDRDLTYAKPEILLNGNKSRVVQLLIYYYLYQQNHPSDQIETGIFSLRNISSGFMSLKETSSKALLDDLNYLIDEILEQLLDPDFLFTHNTKSEFCNFCN